MTPAPPFGSASSIALDVSPLFTHLNVNRSLAGTASSQGTHRLALEGDFLGRARSPHRGFASEGEQRLLILLRDSLFSGRRGANPHLSSGQAIVLPMRPLFPPTAVLSLVPFFLPNRSVLRVHAQPNILSGVASSSSANQGARAVIINSAARSAVISSIST